MEKQFRRFFCYHYIEMKKRKKTQKKYYCKKCDFTSKNKTDFNRHLSTTKHKMVTNGNSNGNRHISIRAGYLDIEKRVLKRINRWC